MTKMLITGATGFLGSKLIKELVEHYPDIQVIATDLSGNKAQEQDWFSKVEFIEADLNNTEEDFYELFKKPDKLIHLAWEGLPNYKEAFHIERNLPSNFLFLKNMIEHGLKDITITGTCLEYGMQSDRLEENMPTAPQLPYAIAKDNLRKQLMELKNAHDLSLKWIRLFYMYGAGQKWSIFAQLEKAITAGDKTFNMSGGEQLRDYLPVEKVVEYIIKISLQNNTTGIINCCSGQPISIKDLVTGFLKNKKASIDLNYGHYPYPDYEPMEFWGDNKKLNKILEEANG